MADSTLAYIFDLDGTLVDSMKYYASSWKEALVSFGIHIEEAEIYEREGEPAPISALEIYSREKGSAPSQALIQEMITARDKLFWKRYETVFLPGALDLLKSLRRHERKLALVTGSSNIRERFSDRQDFLDFFQVIVTGKDTPRGKPYPDPFLKATEDLGVPVEAALVVENAPLGLRAAKAAKIQSVAVLGDSPLPKERLLAAGAHCVVRDIAELRVILSV